jgi:GldH_lipo: gliding motility-associated lipoprotein GldH
MDGTRMGKHLPIGNFYYICSPLHPANYTIKIMSGMKDEKLQGLSDVGIRIEKQ